MIKQFENLLNFINENYIQKSIEWNKINNNINFKNTEVNEILKNEEILEIIYNYRNFINSNISQFLFELEKFNIKNFKVYARVKAKNSIEYKLNNYIEKRNEKGNVPINKCFNDILGIRCIIPESIDFKNFKQEIKSKYNKFKCIDSTKGEYRAIHLYFKTNNFVLPWELQIWSKINEISNLNSHTKYKQAYTKWEINSEEVNKNDSTLYFNE